MFKKVKEIRSKGGALHFRRWQILKLKNFAIYIHGIYMADEDKHMHDHPWNFMSIPFWGGFIEVTEKGERARFLIPRYYKAGTFHKIDYVRKKGFTLVFMGKRRREWGYNVDGKFIDHITYRELKNKGKL